ncbi:MAG: hypothetical protein ACRDLF_02670 [Solirubrobacteraceae bacterium]
MTPPTPTRPTSTPSAPASALERLAVVLRERGGLIASLVDPTPARSRSARPKTPGDSPRPPISNGGGPAQLAAAGPRARARAEEYELLVEAVYEGYLLHYGAPRIVRPPEADLGLLAGDELYAFGLARLVALGDLAAVAELADVITLTALAQGEGRSELALAVWSAGARAVGWGSSDSHRHAKALARAGEPRALEAMRAAAQPPWDDESGEAGG